MSRRPGRSRFTLVVLVLLSVTAITLDFRGGGLISTLRSTATDVLAPARSAAEAVFGPVRDAISGITGYGALEDENDVLRARIAELEGDRFRDADAAAELESLLELRSLSRFTDLPTVAARVIGTPVSNFEQTIQLDVGTEDGVTQDRPVVDGSGLVGRVVEVSGTRSIVRLVTDPTSAVGVRLSRSGDLGVVEGVGSDRSLALGLVDPGTVVEVRELLVTSGVDGSFFPVGIPVGQVASDGGGGGGLERTVAVQPVVDLERLRFVEVLVGEAEAP